MLACREKGEEVAVLFVTACINVIGQLCGKEYRFLMNAVVIV